MRKPTQLGYCATCNTKIWVFDCDRKPFKRKENCCEVSVLLSDGSRSKIAFCSECLEAGVDAEEAMLNAIDGIKRDSESRPWGDGFKSWFVSQYEELKIVSAEGAVQYDKAQKKMVKIETPTFLNLHEDGTTPEKPLITPEVLQEFILCQ